MRRDEAIATLRAIEPDARALGVTGLYLFGSVARDEAGPDSDIDIFVDYDQSAGLSAFDLIGVGHMVMDRTGRACHPNTRAMLDRLFERGLARASIRVF